MDDLSTTSYAILALLAVRPWTTYELAKQMDRSLRWYWPRAASVLYNEPKRLVAHGLAKAAKKRTGKRPRTVYSITAKGRRALREWLDRPGSGPALEFEALVQVAFADHGTKDQLLRTLRTIRDDADSRLKDAQARMREYVETGGPYPDRLHIIGLTGKLLLEHTALLARWAEWAEAAVVAWPDTRSDSGAEASPDAFELTWLPAARDPAPRPRSAGR